MQFFSSPFCEWTRTNYPTTCFHPFPMPGQQGSLVAASPPQFATQLTSSKIFEMVVKCCKMSTHLPIFAEAEALTKSSTAKAMVVLLTRPTAPGLSSISSHSSKWKNMQSPLEECHKSIARCGRMVLNQGVTSTLSTAQQQLLVFTACYNMLQLRTGQIQ